MRRRNFMALAALASAAAATRRARAQEPAAADVPDGELEQLAAQEIDPYFLEPGDLSDDEANRVTEFENYLELRGNGEDAVMPRGGRPKRTPTYRLLHWTGATLDDPEARLQGPLSVAAAFEPKQAYRMNAQILGFGASSKDWKGKSNLGTLTVELRARLLGEPLTWLYAEQFEIFKNGATTLGNEYVAQREKTPDPVVTDEHNLDVRIQLIRHKKTGGFWRSILKGASYLASSLVGGGFILDAVTQAIPSVRVPRLLQEGVALSQAMFGGMSEERPLWRSGFTSFSVAETGSRMRIRPGYWVALDESIADLRDVALTDRGDRVVVVRRSDGKDIDANFLVLWVEIESGQLGGGEPDAKGAPTPKGRG